MNASGAISIDARLERLLHALERHHVVERIVERAQIRIDLRLHVARKKAEALAGFHRGTREHDATHALPRERVDRHRDGEIRLARSRRADADDDVVVGIFFRYSACPGVFGWMTRRMPGSAIRISPFGAAVAARIAVILAHAQHVVGRERQLLARRVDHALRDRRRALHRVAADR